MNSPFISKQIGAGHLNEMLKPPPHPKNGNLERSSITPPLICRSHNMYYDSPNFFQSSHPKYGKIYVVDL